jgi:hypothetical protein
MTDNRNTARLAAWASAAAIAAVAVTPMILSATSLAAWARDSLGLSGAAPWLVPASLDLAALACIALALAASLRGEAGGAPKLLAWLLVAGSAVANWRHGQAIGTTDAEAYFPALPVLAMVLVELGLRFVRRTALVSAGRTEASLPHWRLARWVRFPRETFAAWSLAVADGITSPAEAVALVRQHRTGAAPAPAVEVSAAASAAGNLVEGPDPELAALPKAEQLRVAFRALDEVNARRALTWLAQQGIDPPAPRYAYEVAATVKAEADDDGPERAELPLRAIEARSA